MLQLITPKVQKRFAEYNRYMQEEDKQPYSKDFVLMLENDIQFLDIEGKMTIQKQIDARTKALQFCVNSGSKELIEIHMEVIKKLQSLIYY